MIRAAVLAVLLVSAAVIGLDTPLVMAGSHPTEGAFVTTWNVTASPYTISIPVSVHTGGTLTIDWGDGTAAVEVTTNGIQSHTYSASGEYQVSMTGDLSRIILSATGGTPDNLASIDQWGDIEWISMQDAFRGVSNMEYHATDAPNLSRVISMQNMFRDASSFNGNLSDWNVSTVTNMDGTFRGASDFNGDVSSWDTSGVTDMRKMFQAASSFNGNLSDWNVSKVTRMDSMFSSAFTFNGDISSWNVSAVTDMNNMFFVASAFNGDISGWNVSAVTDMNNMFYAVLTFNGDISGWNVSAVTDMSSMFSKAFKFNQPLNNWNISAVTDMSSMFSEASKFNQPLNNWNVSAVTDMTTMFYDASTFNGDISSWNVSAVTAMTSMFHDASTFNGYISSWNVSAVTDMSSMFSGASTFNGDISSWDVSKVTTMYYMFSGASTFNGDISSWDVSKVTTMYYMFSGASTFNGDISSWDVSKVTTMYSMFSGASTFNGDISSWDVSAVIYMSNMFNGASSFNQNLGKWYVVPADTDYDAATETTLVVTAIAAQNSVLDGHSPNYGIGTGGNSTLFSMTGSNLVFKDTTPSAQVYKVNVTAPGGDFGTNNHHVFDITVTGEDNHQPDVTAGGSADVYEGSVGRLTGTASDPDTGDILTYQWTHNGTPSLGITIANNTALSTTFEVAGDVTTDTSVTFTLTVNDGTSLSVTKTVGVNIQDSSGAFIATWGTTSPQTNVRFFIDGTNPVIDWGDGSERTSPTVRAQHTYAEAGQYRVIVNGSVDRLYHLDGTGTPEMLRYVDQWGDIEWSSMRDMFHGASNMEYRATYTPDLSRVTTMESMFNQATSFNGDISNWNVSTVTNMRFTFADAFAFNGDISNWNVSKVTDMNSMFFTASVFNGDISNWNVSKVTDMANMFLRAFAFNGDISNWNVSAVTNMRFTFAAASNFNGDISNWNVSKVTDTSSMFDGASMFNGDISNWNVSKVTDMNYMFDGATSFDQPLDRWNVSAVTDMNSMFSQASKFNQPLNNWNVSAVTDMHSMFSGASDFNGDISSWNVSAVTDMARMFLDASEFNQPLNNWDVSAVTDMIAMFQKASKFNQPLNDWNVSAVTDMNFMFLNADDFERNLGKWYVVPADTVYNTSDETSLAITTIAAQNFFLNSNHTPNYGIGTGGNSTLFSMTGSNLVFKATPSAGTYTVNVTAPGGNFGSGNHRILDVTVTGQEDSPLSVDTGPDQRVLDESAVTLSGTVSDSDSTDLTYLWTQNLGSPAVTLTGSDTLMPTFTAPDVSSDVDLVFTLTVDDGTDTVTDTVTVTVHDAEADFVTTWNDIHAGINLPIRSSAGSFTVDWGDGQITEYAAVTTDRDLTHPYAGSGPYTIRISGNFSGIFLGDDSGTAGKLQSIDQWGDIEWTTMAGAFYRAGNMIYNATDVPDLSSVTDMSNMFIYTIGFSSGDLSGWDVSGVTDMRTMFASSDYIGDLSGWDVSSVTDMQNMFSRTTSFNSDLSGWDVSAANNMDGMFYDATSFDSDLSGWDVSSVTTMQNMFFRASSFDSDLSGWDVSAVLHMDDMFDGASSFEQNLGEWYILPAEAAYDITDASLNVTVISAQNSILDGHNPTYGIDPDDGLDSGLFNMTDSTLMFKVTPSAGTYKVNVTAPGGDFGTNNHRVLDITVEGQDDSTVSADAFVTTWKVTDTDKTIKIPVGGQTGNYTVDWGDGTDSTHVSDSTHTYSAEGDYTVSISGDFKKIFLNGVQSSSVSEVKNAKQLRSIEQWGDMEWSSMTSAFRGASKMTYNAVDTPDLSNVKSMEYMFHAARAFNGNLSSWNVSQVTNMGFMYQNARAFNGDISGWNVSKVTNMQAMFASADAFNQPLNRWDVSQVTNMDGMFNDASSFNGDISIWNVSAVTDMSSMFDGASSFNGDISRWNVSAVTDMSSMFNGASSSSFNDNISSWNVSAVTDMSSMFDGAYYFNGDISSWNVSAVTDMNNMFNGVSSFNQTLNDWDVLKVTDMSYMFSGAEVFNQPINDWDVSKVNNTYGMFEFASSFNGNISSWNVSAVTNMNSMFSDASSFNQTLNNWNVSKVTDMSYMFLGAAAFNQPLNGWDVSKVTNTVSMFEYASSFNQPLNDWDVSKVTDMYYMFSSAAAFNQPLNNWNVSKVTDMDNMFSGAEDFNQPLNNWNVSAVTSMRNMFSGASSFEQNLGKWYVVPADTVYNTSDEMSLVITTIAAQNSVLDGHSHYYGIGTGGNSALFSMTGSNLVFKVTPSAETYKVNVTAPEGDFGTNNHRVLDITVEGQDDSTVSADAFVTTWNVTASPYIISIPVEVHAGGMLTIDWGDNVITTVTTNGTQSHTYSASDEYQVSMTGDLSRIILGDVGSTAGKLASIDQWGDIEWSSMKSAFPYTHNMKYNASDVPNLSGVSSMENMFKRALKFDGDLSEWNVSAVTDMHDVFTHASSFNGNVSTWNVSAVTDMGYMFNGASVFNGDISSWNVSAVTNMRDMFDSASVFNGDISRWNVSAVTNMAEMFHIASVFNGDISGWNVSAVTDMNRMFSGASVFNGDISSWNVSSVTDMSHMFSRATSFDSDISGWNVSSVTDMSHMFSRATSFDSDISGWNVSSVKDTSYMFSSARSFNQPLNSWNVSAVTAMTDMFSDSRSFNQNLGEWYILPAESAYDITDASLNVTVISAQNSILDGHDLTYGIDPDNSHDSGLFNMAGSTLMFKVAPSARAYTVNVTAFGFGVFESDNNWRTLTVQVTGQEDSLLSVDAGPDQRVLDESAVTLSGTASDSDSANPTYLWTQNLGSPQVMLEGPATLMPTFTAPDVSSDVDLIFTLTVRDGTETVTDTVTVTVHDAEADFVITWGDTGTGINLPIRSSTGSFTVDWGDGEISKYAAVTTNRNLQHIYDIPGTYTIRISGNFSGISWQDNQSLARHLQSIDQWGDIEWTTMAGAFTSASNMIYNATDVPDLSSVTDMSYMFLSTTSFSSGDLSGWDVSGVTDMRNVFFSSRYTGDLSGWDVSSVTDMQNMFSRASSFDSDLSSWNVSAVNNMASMFFDASSFDSDLSSWNVSAVNNTGSMFFDATSFDSDLSGWDVSSVTDMRTMFTGATSFNSDLSGWNVSAVNNMDDMFSGATSFEQNLGPWYIVLDSDTISYPTQTLKITAQNSFLDGQNPMYGLGVGGYPDLFVVDADAGTLGLDPNSDPSPPPNGIYQVSVTSTGSFGTANHHTVSVTVDNADPAVMPPTFYSSVFNNVTGVLTIVFSETIDAANVVPAKIHIRESGNYTDGITLSAGEFVTVANDTAISFILIASHLTTVTGLTTPELTIEPGAVQDTSGNLIDGTFDVSTAVFVNATSVSSQDTKPYGIAFSNNGTKMFVVGDYHNNINQYTLSIPFDISNATYDGNDERFSALQDTSPRGMAFSNNGTKMFVVGDTNNNINQYALSIPFDISTANFTTAISTPDNYPKGMAFSNDGTKMFVVSSVKSAINQYTLSIPFDLFNATFVASPFDISEQDTYPKDMAFSNDGTKMFVIGARANTINQYTLSAPFDLFNATYDGDGERFSVSSQDDDPAGMTFSNDGAKMFVVGDHGNDVNEYALSSVYPITVTDTANQAPSADAGNARQVDEGGSIILQGSGSDPDGNDSDLTYSWSQSPASPVISFDNQNSATPEITAPSVVAETEITLTLRVDDGTDYATDTMVLTIQDVPPVNQAPSADAGNARQVDEGGSIILQGSGSDPDGNDSDLTYSWSQSPASPVISFDNQNSATPEITAPSVVAETEITLTLRVDDGTDYATDTMVLTIQDVPPVNQAPSADAGNARQVDEGGSIILQGSGSDPDGNDSDLTYSWSQSPASPVISFDNQNSATPEITAPSVVAETEITLTLRVDDGTDYATDTMVLTIQDVPPVNQAPSADAGNARQVDEGGSIILQGSGSDPDGNDSDLTYSWSQSPASPVISFDNQNSATPEITAPSVVAETEITLTLRVDDGTDYATDTMVLTIQDVPPVNQAPSADAGNARQVDEGGSIILQGSGSDPDGNDSDLTYSWSQSPASPVISFDNQNSATPEITAPSVVAETEITLTLRVDDGTDYATDTMVLTIQDVPPVNQAPSADAGNARQVDEGGSIILQGSGSDPDGNDSDLTYSWSQSPASPVISFDNQNSATPEITAPSVVAETEITLTLRVDDGTDYATDTMVLTIQDVPPVNQAPSADAGNARQVDEGGSIILQGSGSDPDGNDSDLTYSWSQSPASPVISFDNQNSATPEITAPSVVAETEITLTLRVDDGTDYATDTMVLTIQDVPPVNQAPSADAGNARQVDEGGSIILQGSGSDPDGNDSDLTYSWSQSPASPVISFDNQNSATPEITAPSVVAETEITLTLRVDDGTDYATDTMVLTIQDVPPVNQAPSADAGNARQVDEGGSIILQGSGSDPDGNDSDLTYSWSQSPASPVISFDNQNSATPEITAPSVVAETEITLTLRVDDGTDYATDTMVLTIQDVTTDNIRPAVNVGPNQTVKEGEQVSMPWTASDPDGDALTYLWSQSPRQPAIFLESPGQSPTTFTTPQVDDDTEFTFTLTVTAGPHNADDSLTITVKNNHSPTVDAGNNRTVNEGVPVTLSGIARDLDDDPLTYEWTIVSGPAPTDLTGDNMESLQFTAPGVAPDEDIVFRFTATDDSGEFAEDTVTITVRDVPITVSSATYNPGSGTLLITFNQDIATVDYSRLHVRSANSDIGGITLFNAVSKDISSNDRTITVVLDSDMREMYTDLTSPHLVVEDGAITDIDGDQTTDVPNQPLRDASSNKRSSSPPPVVHLSALAQARIVDIPAHIAEQISSRDDSDPLEPLMLDDTFDFPLVINNYGYLLDDVTNTLVPQIVTVGDDDPTVITFTVYTQKDLAHFTLYLNLSDENTDYTDSDTYITYKNDGTAVVTDPHGYIADATITVTQEDDSMPEKKTVSITLYFDEPMGPTNMVAYMWNTDRKATFIKIIDAFEVTAVLPESVIQTVDPEPLEPNSELPADPEPSSELPADPEPVSTDTLGPDDYDDAQVLHIIRMWSGFESEFITDEQMLASLGLDYPDADIPDWVMTQLGVLVAKGDVTVEEFVLALQYVLENL